MGAFVIQDILDEETPWVGVANAGTVASSARHPASASGRRRRLGATKHAVRQLGSGHGVEHLTEGAVPHAPELVGELILHVGDRLFGDAHRPITGARAVDEHAAAVVRIGAHGDQSSVLELADAHADGLLGDPGSFGQLGRARTAGSDQPQDAPLRPAQLDTSALEALAHFPADPALQSVDGGQEVWHRLFTSWIVVRSTVVNHIDNVVNQDYYLANVASALRPGPP